MRVVALAGGVGASKLLRGLVRVLPPGSLTVVGNTADDIEVHGLHVSPDLDTIAYTLGSAADPERGWGLAGETWNARDAMERYGMATWFALGDRDLATHLYRTRRLREGACLSEVTQEICAAWNVTTPVLPMTDDPVTNRIVVDVDGTAEDIHFQEYLIRRGSPPGVIRSYVAGVETARPLPAVVEAIRTADALVLCPSNPVVSIGPILAVPGVREAIQRSRARKIAVTPIIGDAPVRGPADKLMPAAGIDVSCAGIARHYADLVDTLVIDVRDRDRAAEVAVFAKCVVADTLMTDLDASVGLARVVCADLGLGGLSA
ncbi:MAG: 2-phospho-L-lactate transferase [Acidimicrobiia bacterium]|nr:2-phospho-L-lactate transferase [Acidimicrobiia bacterium]